ncbi:MAG: type IX secretion system membrane protein PorP/SprF [Cytophagales bacterium]|nr:type IX secretion system membrane protein PorP/SprF [Cytophagales bacterium]
MNKITKALLVLFFTLHAAISYAQDIQFSMFYAVPMYINPAFAGSRHANRFMLHARWQWYLQPAKYYTYFASFDTYFMKYKSGLGASVIQDYQGSSGSSITSTHFNVAYAYEVRLTNAYTLRFGLQGGFISSGLGAGVLPADLVNDREPVSSGGFAGSNIAPDISFGALFFTRRLWASFSMHHLNKPDIKFTPLTKEVWPVKITLTGGYKIPILLHPDADGKHSDNPIMMSIIPTATWKTQGGTDSYFNFQNDQIDLGIYWTYKWMLAGVWYRGIPIKATRSSTADGSGGRYYPNNESVVFLVGGSLMGIGFGYAYDLTVSTQGIGTGGVHEINLSYVFRTRRAPKFRRLPCPDFEYDLIKRN